MKAVKSGTDQEMIRVRIIELLDGRTTYGRGHYDFHQLPLTADKIVVHNRRGLYDIMGGLSTAPAPETTIYVKWIAER